MTSVGLAEETRGIRLGPHRAPGSNVENAAKNTTSTPPAVSIRDIAQTVSDSSDGLLNVRKDASAILSPGITSFIAQDPITEENKYVKPTKLPL